MTALPIFARISIWVVGFYKLEALRALMIPLRFSLQIVAKLLCSCLCLFDTIIELHTMDGKMFNDLFHWKVKVEFECNKDLFNPRFVFFYVVETFITLN